ncbi:DUF4180 domain-containing protein [Bacillus sp. 165]|uniref:DUF4180 domain-containing protein n=1 Tax=Bacillus sp. 165 TaxID=1529117 RepID=UPI001AD97940|nr:DUF4180 domain-containing protein [Bacillus sp. 165]MBO9129383.1 DUF4180 domain-containing protein [Bacillus sp. 165]
MELHVYEEGESKVAVVESCEIVIRDVQGALDLMASALSNYGCYKLIIHAVNITEDFFTLRKGLAGEILQKYANYNMKLAIVGDFQIYNSKSLADFIYECNQGKQVLFLQDEQTALHALHAIR